MENQNQEERILQGKKRALRLLERKDYSRKELIEKLLKDGYEEEIREQIIDYVDSFHYLDDKRVAGSYIRTRKEGKSRRELEYMLKQKGISEEDIAQAMEENYQNEDGIPQEELAVQRQLQKYHVSEKTVENLTYEEKQKIAAKLYRKGFSQDVIRRGLQL